MTEDGWPAAVARPAKKQPAKQETAASFSDDFSTDRTGTQWQFAGEYDPQRARRERTLVMQARGNDRPTPVRCCSLPEIMPMKWRSKRNARRKQSPDWCSFTIETLYRNRPGQRTPGNPRARQGRVVRRQNFPGTSGSGCGTTGVVSFWYSPDGRNWTKADKSAKPRAITTTWPESS